MRPTNACERSACSVSLCLRDELEGLLASTVKAPDGWWEALLEFARSPSLEAWDEHVTDWHIVDSSTVMLDQAMFAEYLGAGDYAALKIHTRFSVGLGTTIDYHLSRAREHDNIHLEIDETWRGLGVLQTVRR